VRQTLRVQGGQLCCHCFGCNCQRIGAFAISTQAGAFAIATQGGGGDPLACSNVLVLRPLLPLSCCPVTNTIIYIIYSNTLLCKPMSGGAHHQLAGCQTLCLPIKESTASQTQQAGLDHPTAVACCLSWRSIAIVKAAGMVLCSQGCRVLDTAHTVMHIEPTQAFGYLGCMTSPGQHAVKEALWPSLL